MVAHDCPILIHYNSGVLCAFYFFDIGSTFLSADDNPGSENSLARFIKF